LSPAPAGWGQATQQAADDHEATVGHEGTGIAGVAQFAQGQSVAIEEDRIEVSHGRVACG
jgi:hypothetical protein